MVFHLFTLYKENPSHLNSLSCHPELVEGGGKENLLTPLCVYAVNLNPPSPLHRRGSKFPHLIKGVRGISLPEIKKGFPGTPARGTLFNS
jgi:hypothetical protein